MKECGSEDEASGGRGSRDRGDDIDKRGINHEESLGDRWYGLC